MKPTVGRIVHYTDYSPGNTPMSCAALVTTVNEDSSLGLAIFYPWGGSTWLRAVWAAGHGIAAGTEPALGKWQWPARESA